MSNKKLNGCFNEPIFTVATNRLFALIIEFPCSISNFGSNSSSISSGISSGTGNLNWEYFGIPSTWIGF